jgi:hypothetical protein
MKKALVGTKPLENLSRRDSIVIIAYPYYLSIGK